MMKKLPLVLCLCFPLLAAGQTHIQFNLSLGNLSIAPYTNVEVILQQVGLNQNSTMTFLSQPIPQWTDTNGVTTFSNLQTAANGATSYWRWDVPANSTPYGPITSSGGYVQVTSTNLGVISSSLCQVITVPTATGLGWAYSAQTSDLRYSPTTTVLTNYALVGQVNTASNALANQIVGATNGQTSIVYSNPAAYTTPPTVTNIVLSLAVTSAPTSLATITNIASQQATNQGYASTNFTLATSNSISAAWLAAVQGTNTALAAAIVATNSALSSSITANSNGLKSITQPASGILTNLTVTGAVTNQFQGGANFTWTTNVNGSIWYGNATNQTFLTNGITAVAFLAPGSVMLTNALPALTNGFVTGSVTNGLATLQNATNIAQGVYSNNPAGYLTSAGTNSGATTNFVIAYADTNGAAKAAIASLAYQPTSSILTAISVTGANTNVYQAGQNSTLSSNVSGSIFYWNATNQTFLTNGITQTAYLPLASVMQTNLLPGLTNGFQNLAALNNASNGAVSVALNAVQGSNSLMQAVVIATNAAILNLVTNYADINGAATSVYTSISNSLNGVSGGFKYIFDLAGDYLSQGEIQDAYGDYMLRGTISSGGGGFFATETNVTSPKFIGPLSGTATNALTAKSGWPTNWPVSAITNLPGGFQSITNGFAQGFFGFGTKTNFLISTNVIGINGQGAGTYIGAAGSTLWTNVNQSAFTILNAGGLYFIVSNGITLFQSPNVQTWSAVAGSAPFPSGDFGTVWNVNGLNKVGWYSFNTNEWFQITNYVALNGGTGGGGTNGTTNFILSGVVGGYTTNNSFSATGTNVIAAIAIASVGSPTNGTTLSQVTNVVTGMTNGLATMSFVTNYVTGVTNTVTSQYLTAIGISTNGFVTSALTNGFWNSNGVIGYVSTVQAGQASNAIAILNGRGTNTTFVGPTYLINSNLIVYPSGFMYYRWNQYEQYSYSFVQARNLALFSNGVSLIPVMTANNAPSGLCSADSSGANPPWYAFSTNYPWASATGVGLHWIQYQFPAPVVANAFAGQFAGDANADLTTVTGSYDGTNWFVLFTNAAAIGQSLFTNSVPTAAGIYAQASLQIISTNGGLSIIVSNGGVSINTVEANSNALEVAGNVDSTTGFTVNGTPIGQANSDYAYTNSGGYIQQTNGFGVNAVLTGTNIISGTSFIATNYTITGIVVSGAGSPHTNANGLYLSATNNGLYFTNANGVIYANQGYVANGNSAAYFIGNITNQTLNKATEYWWYSFAPIGSAWNYYQSSGIGNLNVSYQGFTSTNARVSINTNSAGTNTLEVNGNVDSTVGYTVNGQPAFQLPAWVVTATNSFDTNGAALAALVTATNSFDTNGAALAALKIATNVQTTLAAQSYFATNGAQNFQTNATALVSSATYYGRNNGGSVVFLTSGITQQLLSNYFTINLTGPVPTTNALIVYGVCAYGTNNSLWGTSGTINKFIAIPNAQQPSNSITITSIGSAAAGTAVTYGISWGVIIPN